MAQPMQVDKETLKEHLIPIDDFVPAKSPTEKNDRVVPSSDFGKIKEGTTESLKKCPVAHRFVVDAAPGAATQKFAPVCTKVDETGCCTVNSSNELFSLQSSLNRDRPIKMKELQYTEIKGKEGSNVQTYVMENMKSSLKTFFDDYVKTNDIAKKILSKSGESGRHCSLIKNFDEQKSPNQLINFMTNTDGVLFPWQYIAIEHIRACLLIPLKPIPYVVSHSILIYHGPGAGKSTIIAQTLKNHCAKETTSLYIPLIIATKSAKEFNSETVAHLPGTTKDDLDEKQGGMLKMKRIGSLKTYIIGSANKTSHAVITDGSTLEETEQQLTLLQVRIKEFMSAGIETLMENKVQGFLLIIDEIQNFTSSQERFVHLRELINTLQDFCKDNRLAYRAVLLSGTPASNKHEMERLKNICSAITRLSKPTVAQQIEPYPISASVSFLDDVPSSLLAEAKVVRHPDAINFPKGFYEKNNPAYLLEEYFENFIKKVIEIQTDSENQTRQIIFLPKQKTEHSNENKHFLSDEENVRKFRASLEKVQTVTTKNMSGPIIVNARVFMSDLETKTNDIIFGFGVQLKDGGEAKLFKGLTLESFGQITDVKHSVNPVGTMKGADPIDVIIGDERLTGIDFYGVTDIHFLGTPDSYTEYKQNRYRGLRICSHFPGSSVNIHHWGFVEPPPSTDPLLDFTNDYGVDLGFYKSKKTDKPARVVKTNVPEDLRQTSLRSLRQRMEFPEQFSPGYSLKTEEDIKSYIQRMFLPTKNVFTIIRDYEKTNQRQRTSVTTTTEAIRLQVRHQILSKLFGFDTNISTGTTEYLREFNEYNMDTSGTCTIVSLLEAVTELETEVSAGKHELELENIKDSINDARRTISSKFAKKTLFLKKGKLEYVERVPKSDSQADIRDFGSLVFELGALKFDDSSFKNRKIINEASSESAPGKATKLEVIKLRESIIKALNEKGTTDHVLSRLVLDGWSIDSIRRDLVEILGKIPTGNKEKVLDKFATNLEGVVNHYDTFTKIKASQPPTRNTIPTFIEYPTIDEEAHFGGIFKKLVLYEKRDYLRYVAKALDGALTDLRKTVDAKLTTKMNESKDSRQVPVDVTIEAQMDFVENNSTLSCFLVSCMFVPLTQKGFERLGKRGENINATVVLEYANGAYANDLMPVTFQYPFARANEFSDCITVFALLWCEWHARKNGAEPLLPLTTRLAKDGPFLGSYQLTQCNQSHEEELKRFTASLLVERIQELTLGRAYVWADVQELVGILQTPVSDKVTGYGISEKQAILEAVPNLYFIIGILDVFKTPLFVYNAKDIMDVGTNSPDKVSAMFCFGDQISGTNELSENYDEVVNLITASGNEPDEFPNITYNPQGGGIEIRNFGVALDRLTKRLSARGNPPKSPVVSGDSTIGSNSDQNQTEQVPVHTEPVPSPSKSNPPLTLPGVIWSFLKRKS
jgi:hypothetical protein